MASAEALRPGMTYRVVSGPLLGERVTVITNKVFPDSDPRRRKVTVEFDGSVAYLLPRVLADEPEPVEAVVPDDTQSSSVDQDDPATVAQQLMQQTALSSLGTTPIVDPMDDRLDHLRPNPAKVRRYISRIMKNGKTDIETLLAYAGEEYRRDNDDYAVPFALKGPTQSGKTMVVAVLAVKLAKERGLPKPYPIFTLSGSAGVTDYDFFGQPTSLIDARTGRDRIVHLPGTVELWAQAGGILYIDEINAIPPRYAISLNPVLDHRHEFTNRGKAVVKGGSVMAETVKLHPECWAMTTYNEGYEDMAKMNKSLHQRFDHILWDYDPVVEKTLVKNENLHRLAEAFRLAYQNRKINIPVSTALLQRIQRNISIHGVEMALEIFLGMFDERHRIVADEILNAQTLRSSLLEDEKQARINAEQAAAQFQMAQDAGHDPLAQVLGQTLS
jgi:MoxR-like ATPase